MGGAPTSDEALPSILGDLSIHNHRQIFSRRHVLKLHNLMSFASKLAPATGLGPILFDGLYLPSIDRYANGS